MFNYKRIGAIIVALITAYCIWIALRPTKIHRQWVFKSIKFPQSHIHEQTANA